MSFSRIRISDLGPAIVGVSIGAVFPFLALFALWWLPDPISHLLVSFLGAPLWLVFTGFVWLCPSTRDSSGLGASNECIFMVIPLTWFASVVIGAVIGIAIDRYRRYLQKRRDNKVTE